MKEWFELFKDGFLLLGATLTTLISYYFGNRGADAMLKKAKELENKAQETWKNVAQQAPTVEDDTYGIEPLKED